MRFVVDEQLPPRLAEWLRDAGHDARHILEIGIGGAKDAAIFELCATDAAVLITKDADFTLRRALQVQVVWLRFGNLPTKSIIRRFESVFDEVQSALAAGELLIEVV